MEKRINITLRNQRYRLSQEFTKALYEELNKYNIMDNSLKYTNNNYKQAAKIMMLIIDDLLDHISKNENNIIIFDNPSHIYKYKDFIKERGILLKNEL